VFFKNKKVYQILQQNLYNDDNRYIKWLKNNSCKTFDRKEILILIAAFIPNVTVQTVAIVLLTILFIVSVNDKKAVAKIKFVLTKRVKRLYVTTYLIYLIMYLIFRNNLPLIYVSFTLLTMALYYLAVIVNIINKPVERLVFIYYRTKASKKLEDMNYMDVIGITGSYGKTSTKNILFDILQIKYNVYKTPKSYNTMNGTMRTINNDLDKFSDLFISEMGAYKIGEIKEICDFVKPKYGILTNVGKAHLEIFKSEKNIQTAKFELIESLPSDGLGILNMDDKNQTSYKLKNNCRILWVSLKNKKADLYATNIKLTEKGSEFDCIFKGDNIKYHFEMKLLGEHNIYNTIASILLAKELGMEIDKIKRGVASIRPIEHRLQLKKLGRLNIIDDAYNSNPVGSKMAIDVLSKMDGQKVVVTPGMIELGTKQEELNEEFGKYIAKVADKVILVGKKQTEPIYNGLKAKKYADKNIYIVNDVKEAFKLMNTFEDNTYVLLENDLPDIFNEE
jgi:UDP-N-acetylmuramoyl-tripeptide--D-alanyl-D-alanine ligase